MVSNRFTFYKRLCIHEAAARPDVWGGVMDRLSLLAALICFETLNHLAGVLLLSTWRFDSSLSNQFKLFRALISQ